ncbi:UPF0739 protein C1orf74 homolog [Aplysia californica]|uniref:UPF0739 protein C1orf74 homolog n=1 Tax=Aplysia californica TaxID=6500 RepID=A0ABM1A3U5_APLCA|nr:UPF0739 protein C1orf74 homolog [Aplysia californica]XP_005102362.1 UPF0739 protein C1orf74 homolog [Aplysia californica]XP_012940278.1 UPF0739 protein C1orf74 homolog [Aplysia californica]
MEWRKLMCQKFGRRASKKWCAAAKNILLVDKGIKQTLLFDHWAVSAQEMEDFLLTSHDARLTENRILTLTVGLDIFLFRCGGGDGALVSWSFLCDDGTRRPQTFIDVSKRLELPVILNEDDDRISETKRVFEDCVRQMTVVEGERQVVHRSVDISETLNVPCLFGLLLGYPSVYWYDVSESAEHCLSSLPLHLFCVEGVLQDGVCDVNFSSVGQGKVKDSDSEKNRNCAQLPVSTCSGNNGKAKNYVTELSTTVSKVKDSSDIHTILSFTVPENVVHLLGSSLHEWFAEWKSCVPWSRIFSDVRLSEQKTEPQAVCL